jgi:hypothetical protein
MEQRRRELGIRWGDVTARGGPSVETMRAIRRGDGRPIKELTLAAIARGLGLPAEEVEELAAADEAGWPAAPEGAGAHPDPFEAAILAASAPADVKATLIREHRERIEQEREQLAELGITGPPSLLREAVRRYAGEPGSDEGQRRGA